MAVHRTSASPRPGAGSDFLLYGANGYTGRLILQRALSQGLRPMLAGRRVEEVRALAREHRLDYRGFQLDSDAALDAALDTVPVVLHAAGPFAHTAMPMAQACLRTGTHYLDITGEIEVFEQLHGLDVRAREAGVMLLPGIGFDVVPTDLLAAHLLRRLPGATRLRLAFRALRGGISRGTATTMVENLGRGGAVRLNGRITRVPAAWLTRTVAFGFFTNPVKVTTIPWGDVATAWHSTGIPDVEVYTCLRPHQRAVLVSTRGLGWLLGSATVQRLLKARIRAAPAGPGEEQRRRSVSLVWGEVEDAAGRRAVSRMRTPEGYTLTAMTSVAAVQKVLGGHAPVGFQTPSLAYGADWILELDDVRREDVE
jgi:short subunit dehydrogenase-like uncharacterized protein